MGSGGGREVSGALCQILAHPSGLSSQGPPPEVLPEPGAELALSPRLPCSL